MKKPGEIGKAFDVVCDACGMLTRGSDGELHFGTMKASWGEGSVHCGEEYELHLCEACFFKQISLIKRNWWVAVMLNEEGDTIQRDEAYGRIKNNQLTTFQHADSEAATHKQTRREAVRREAALFISSTPA